MSDFRHDLKNGAGKSTTPQRMHFDPEYKPKGPLFRVGHTSGELDGKK